MSEIRCIYHPLDGEIQEPKFPPTAQHPDAERFVMGNYVIDAIGKPTQKELNDELAKAVGQTEPTISELADEIASLRFEMGKKA